MKTYIVKENGFEVWAGEAESEDDAILQAYDGIDMDDLGCEIASTITAEEEED